MEDMGTDDGITPHLDVLAEGPPAFGYTKFAAVVAGVQGENEVDMKEIQKITDSFHHVIGHYVVGAFGYINMMALLKENKGSSVWNYLHIDNLVDSIFIVKNRKDS